MNRRDFAGLSLAVVGSIFVPQFGAWYPQNPYPDDVPALLRRLQRGEVVMGEDFRVGSTLVLPPSPFVMIGCKFTATPRLCGMMVDARAMRDSVFCGNYLNLWRL